MMGKENGAGRMTSSGRGARYSITAAAVVSLLIKIAAALTVLSVVGQVINQTLVKGAGIAWLGHPVRFFDLNRERNLPTWYQGLSLLLCAATLWGIASAGTRGSEGAAKGEDAGAGPGGAAQGGWRGLAVIFAYLGCDELFKWHERTIDPLRAWLKIEGGALMYAWVVPGFLIVGAVGLLYARFFFRLPAGTRWRFALAAGLYVGGALGMELVGGIVHTRYGYNSPPYVAAAQMEEVLEMSGVIVFMHALLTHAAAHVPVPLRLGPLSVRITPPTRPPALLAAPPADAAGPQQHMP